ncbi:MAG: ShlB/FhaC/HecB family hemolysin secretion/activation protein, partial [Planctomycetota bacterium]|nr:ShlB/FhaC/HecB family hemolysin secretion/activation protein [Planctomycetota bacterium]
LLAVLFILPFCLAEAEDIERIAPKQPEPSETPRLPEATLPDAIESNKVILNSLKGIVIVGSLAEVSKEAINNVTDVQVKSPSFLNRYAFKRKLSPYLNEPLTEGQLHRIRLEVILYCRKQADRPVVNGVAPEQEVTTGVLQLLVVVGRVGDVRFRREKWFDEERMSKQVRTSLGSEIRKSVLQEDLDWLNENSFRKVKLIYGKGEIPGETNLIFDVTDQLPFRAFAGYEDTGNDVSGNDRLYAGFNWGNMFGTEKQLSYQYTTDTEFDRSRSHSMNVLVPFNWHHKFQVIGSYSDFSPELTGVSQSGVTWQISPRYVWPRPALKAIEHNLTFGFDFKRSNNDIDVGGLPALRTQTDVNQFLISWNPQIEKSWGTSRLTSTLYWSPGGISGSNDDASFAASRTNATADYTFANFRLGSAIRLPSRMTLNVSGEIQFADGNLTGSEQIGLGGYSSVRGYDERAVNGDEGWRISTELKSPSYSVLRRFIGGELRDQLQFLAFFEFGETGNKMLTAGEIGGTSVASVGPGLRYRIGPNLSIRFDYGFQLSSKDLDSDDSRAHVGVTLSF